MQIVEEFRRQGYLLSASNARELEKALIQINDFVPKKYISDNKKIIRILEEYIDNL